MGAGKGTAKRMQSVTDQKLLIRDEFREGVFARDNYKCVVCGAEAKDAHHIMERRLWVDGGYYLDNGVSLCEEHHLLAEQTLLTPEELRLDAGIKNVLIPPHLDAEVGLGEFGVLDKWGNIIKSKNQRLPGELFFDESVQKILERGNVLQFFSERVKYPRTPHIPASPGGTPDDLLLDNLNHFKGKNVVITEKIDGESTTLYHDYVHARSVDSKYHPTRTWVQQLQARIGKDIPEGWRLCGENVFGQHSIYYDKLPSYFFLFSVWDEKNNCLSWHETKEWAELLDLQLAPVIYEGMFDEKLMDSWYPKPMLGDTTEGYVMRTEEGFPYVSFRKHLAKYVRADHTTEHDKHWMHGKVDKNKLIDE